MTKSVRKRSARVMQSLSRPRDAAYVNALEAVKEKPTPDRAEIMMEFAEDMEEYVGGEELIKNFMALITISSN